MFARIVIANRGEIALRVVRTCREMGIESAVVVSDADRASAAARLADHVIHLGDPWCYLDSHRIIAAARQWGANAIHPGYGFLAENPHFSGQCTEAKIAFIGPNAIVMQHLGEKDRAKALANKLGIDCLPGTDEAVADETEAAAAAKKIGYPVLIKAVAGGGGRGMRLARDEAELRAQLPRAMSEAQAAFQSAAVYLEKYLIGARHVEVQVLADTFGKIIHLGERDCTVQRRHQKLLEESPSPAVTNTLRAKLGSAATRLLSAVNYSNAGTVEFLIDQEGNSYFLEVNTRIQVEHPLTELLYGVDLIAEQIRIAAGQPLSLQQSRLVRRGWAIECRINAEDPTRGFAPKPGRITHYSAPAGPGVRIDGAAFSGWSIPPFYDSMIAKVVVWGTDRAAAIARMERALRELAIDGVPTTVPFHLAVLAHEDFRSGRFDTRFVETSIDATDIDAMATTVTPTNASEEYPPTSSTKHQIGQRSATPVNDENAKGQLGPVAGVADLGPDEQDLNLDDKSALTVKRAANRVVGRQFDRDAIKQQVKQDGAPAHSAASKWTTRHIAAITAAVAAMIDRPYRIVAISPVDSITGTPVKLQTDTHANHPAYPPHAALHTHATLHAHAALPNRPIHAALHAYLSGDDVGPSDHTINFWGAAGRFQQMQGRQRAANIWRDRRN